MATCAFVVSSEFIVPVATPLNRLHGKRIFDQVSLFIYMLVKSRLSVSLNFVYLDDCIAASRPYHISDLPVFIAFIHNENSCAWK